MGFDHRAIPGFQFFALEDAFQGFFVTVLLLVGVTSLHPKPRGIFAILHRSVERAVGPLEFPQLDLTGGDEAKKVREFLAPRFESGKAFLHFQKKEATRGEAESTKQGLEICLIVIWIFPPISPAKKGAETLITQGIGEFGCDPSSFKSLPGAGIGKAVDHGPSSESPALFQHGIKVSEKVRGRMVSKSSGHI